LSEIYLWLLIPITGFAVLLSQLLAGVLQWDQLATYRMISLGHFLLTVTALGILATWRREEAAADSQAQPVRLAAGLFVLGAAIFWSGAVTFRGMDLNSVSANAAAHNWTSGTFLVATILTLFGFSLFARASDEAGDRFLSFLGLVAYLLGAVFWIMHLAFRLTVQISAAQQATLTGTDPAWYEPWRFWNSLLFGFYHVLAYLAIALNGAAILKTGLLPRWVGWIWILFALLMLPSFGPPLMVHIPLWLGGMLVLRQELSRKARAGIVPQ
jgi:hypothetical protein